MKLQYAPIDVLSRLVEDLRLVQTGRPSVPNLDGAPLLYNHRIVSSSVGILAGIVDGHPKLRAGQEITTSQVFYLDSDLGIARTLSRWYRLETPAHNGGN
ncbi:DUF6634 family protein [Rhizobium laguerreae]|uniref:DUF6634 family protein n=1 Tax=Rhizobium laguerreae TaxID=1076926 RepID=UPI001C92625E|nr:DUF6634 family protein [Rhizobium laguerreae]MBY3201776.1 hypothetical protein [Rhizobium laguerreae]